MVTIVNALLRHVTSTFCTISAFLALAGSSAATTITADIGPQGIVGAGERDYVLNGLYGIPLQGQNWSLHITFSRDEFIRLYTASYYPNGTSGSNFGELTFDVLALLQTNATGSLDYPTGTAYAFGSTGNPVIPVQTTGGGSVSGFGALRVGVGVFPLLNQTNPSLPLDFYGVHFDLTLPFSANHQIESGTLRLVSNSVYGVGPGIPANMVPEGGSSLLLFGVGLAAICLPKARRFFRLKS